MSPEQLPIVQRYAPAAPAVGDVELRGEHDPIVYVPDAYNPTAFVAVRQSQLQPTAPTQPRNLTPRPVVDPMAARFLGVGVGAGAAGAGIGWGVGQAAMGIAAIGGSSGLIVLAMLLLAARLAGRRGGSTTTIHNEVHNHNRWLGRSTTHL